MNRKQWEERNEDELDIAFQDTTKSEYADKEAFIDAMWNEHKANEDEAKVLNFESKWWNS